MIGVFDSGSGGLTVLKALRQELPSADIAYFGDTKNAPYGPKSREELTQLTVLGIERLQREGAARIISACNSVSASLAVSLCDTLIPEPGSLIEMVGPTVAAFRGSSARIIIFATEATVKSEIYQNGFRMIGNDAAIVAVPELAGALEDGAPEAEIGRIVSEAVHGIELDEMDIAVLACTHYPLAVSAFRNALPRRIRLFDPAGAVAERAKKLWWPQEVGDGTLRFLISKDSVAFRAFVSRLFPNSEYSLEVVE